MVSLHSPSLDFGVRLPLSFALLTAATIGCGSSDRPATKAPAPPAAPAAAAGGIDGATFAPSLNVDLKMEGDTVTDFSHVVKACALGQASSSIMARNVIGAKAEELRSLREAVRRMLKENGAPPEGKWADIAVLEPVRDYKARHASTMLTFDAVTAAIDQIEEKRKAALTAN